MLKGGLLSSLGSKALHMPSHPFCGNELQDILSSSPDASITTFLALAISNGVSSPSEQSSNRPPTNGKLRPGRRRRAPRSSDSQLSGRDNQCHPRAFRLRSEAG